MNRLMMIKKTLLLVSSDLLLVEKCQLMVSKQLKKGLLFVQSLSFNILIYYL